MAKEILKNDSEEYDAKQPPVKTQDSLKSQAAEWRGKVDGISDKKLLGYVMDCCSAKMQQMSADERLGEKEPDKGDKIEASEME